MAGAVHYGLSVVNGLATFAALKILQHSVETDELFSRFSVLILSFTTFQLLSDLGTHTEFMRSHAQTPDTDKPALCHVLIQSRLALGALIVGVAAVYSFASGFSEQMTLAFVCYHLAFIPFAILSSADSIFLVRREFTKAVFSRVARIISLAVFLLTVARLEAAQQTTAALASTATFCVIAFVTWKKFLRPALTNSKSAGLFSRQWWTHLGTGTRHFVHGSTLAATLIGIHAAHGIVSHSLLVRTLGEENLTPLNTGVALATPAILAFQTLVQLVHPSLPQWSQLSAADLARRYGTFFLQTLLILGVTSAGLWWAQSAGLVHWFFPRATAAVTPICQSLIVAHWLLNLAAIGMNMCQYKNRFTHVLILLLGTAAVALAVQSWWIHLLQEHAYVLSLLTLGVLLTLGSWVISVRAQPISMAKT